MKDILNVLAIISVSIMISLSTPAFSENQKHNNTNNTPQQTVKQNSHSANQTSTTKQGKTKASKRGDLIVKFKQGISNTEKQAAHTKHHGKLHKKLRRLDAEVVNLEESTTLNDALKAYRNDPAIEYVDVNWQVSINQNIPDDQKFDQLWGMHNIGQNLGTVDADIDAPEAWSITTGSADVVVVVIDTGVDYMHEDLAANIWTNDAELNGITGVDDDNNGYIDDIHGINAIDSSGNPMDDHFHGTHVSGTIGAVGNNGIGVAGVNWHVKIMACKFLSSEGSGYTSDALECLEYVLNMKERGVNIVATSNSWGGGAYMQSLYNTLLAQQANDILFIAAAGNRSEDADIKPHFPSSYDLPNIIAVAATDHRDAVASFSNYGRYSVDIAAPGVNVLSSVPENEYASYSGTSMATPHVSGLAALIKAANPGFNGTEIRNLIFTGGEPLDSVANITATGRGINAYNSLACTNASLVRTIDVPNRFEVGKTIALSAMSIRCSEPAGPVTVSSCGNYLTTLQDDGVYPDDLANDGVFSAEWTPTSALSELLFESPIGSDRYNPDFYVDLGEITPTSPAQIGLPVTIHAVPAPFCENQTLEYKLEKRRLSSNSTWEEVSSWQTSPVLQWDTAGNVAGNYELMVKARIQGEQDYVSAKTTYTIGNYQPIIFPVASYGYEPDGSIQIPIKLTNATTEVTSVDYFTVDNTAISPDDYLTTSGTVTFAPGEISKIVTVPVLNDALPDSAETFTLRITNPSANAAIVTSSAVITIRDDKPDLVLTHVSVPSSGVTADKLPVTVRIRNIGPGETWQSGSVSIYLSTDNLIDAGDVFLGNISFSPLASGGESEITRSFFYPYPIQSQSYYVYALADNSSLIDETDENNNSLVGNSIAVTVVPVDLLAARISGPASHSNAGELMFDFDVQNIGGMPTSDPLLTIIWLSLDDTLDYNEDLVAGYDWDDDVIYPGGDTTDVIFANGSYLPPGTYYLFEEVDFLEIIPELDETNNILRGEQITIFEVRPDLIMTEVQGPSVANSGTEITITNTMRNIGDRKGGVHINLYLSTDASITSDDLFLGQRTTNYALAPGAEHTDDTVIRLPLDLDSGTYYLGAIADGPDYYLEWDESNNALAGNSIDITRVYPDLQITSLSGPDAARTEETVTFSGAVANTGQEDASTYIKGQIYLSTDQTITTADIPVTTFVIAEDQLNAGAVSNWQVNYRIPSNFPIGTYYLGAVFDHDQREVESNESNNSITGNQIEITKALPDLIAASISASATGNTYEGFTANLSLANQGLGAVMDDFKVFIYLSTDVTITADDVYISNWQVEPDGEWFLYEDLKFSIPKDLASGTYYFGVIVDRNDEIVESNETNNTAVSGPIEISRYLADLTISQLDGPASAAPGTAITITNAVTNQGQLDAYTNTTIQIAWVLSTDANITEQDIYLGSRYTFVADLKVDGESMAQNTGIIPPSVAEGNYYLGAIADYTGTVEESNESNNTLAFPITISRPKADLVVTSISAPATGTIGNTILVPYTIQNLGGNAVSASSLGIYLSTDETVTTADRYLGGANFSASQLAAGSVQTGQLNLTVPTNLAPGTYTIGAIVDRLGQETESNETNNVLAGGQIAVIMLYSDLVMTNVSSPAQANFGQQIAVNTTIANQGDGAPLTTASIGIYLSTDNIITTSDFYLGGLPVYKNNVPAGGQYSTSTSIYITDNMDEYMPYLPPGTYYIGAIADISSQVVEANESNNALAGNQITIE